MSNIAIIPARGGSKRIPRKNIKDFLGKPAISYPIAAAIKSGLFTTVMVSTDDSEIADVAREHGAVVPFMRSEENSTDTATTADVILEVLQAYAVMGITYTNLCCIYPAAVFVTAQTLTNSFSILNGKDSVVPVIEYGHPIQRAFQIVDTKLHMMNPEYKLTRSQDLAKTYHDAGQFYWLNCQKFTATKSLFTANTAAYVVSELEAQDIDSITDWKLAEIKYKMINNLS